MTAAFLTYATPLRRPRSNRREMCAQRSTPRASAAKPGAVQTIAYGEALMDLHENKAGASVENEAEWTECTGGAPFNFACALGKLGHQTAYIGALGEDKRADILSEELRNVGVCTDGVQRLVGHPTRGVFVRYNEGQPTFAGYSTQGSLCADAQRLDHDKIPESLFRAADVLVTGTLGLASPGSADSLRYLAKLARETNTWVAVDVNWRPVFWTDSPMGVEGAREIIMEFLRENASYVKASTEDLNYLLDGDDFDDTMKLIEKFGDQCRGVLVTDGEHGTRFAFKDGKRNVSGAVDAFKVRGGAIDCVGAGDAFFAGFIAETFRLGGFEVLCEDDKAERICRFAAAVAHFVVAGKGAVAPQPSTEIVEKFLVRC